MGSFGLETYTVGKSDSGDYIYRRIFVPSGVGGQGAVYGLLCCAPDPVCMDGDPESGACSGSVYDEALCAA